MMAMDIDETLRNDKGEARTLALMLRPEVGLETCWRVRVEGEDAIVFTDGDAWVVQACGPDIAAQGPTSAEAVVRFGQTVVVQRHLQMTPIDGVLPAPCPPAPAVFRLVWRALAPRDAR